MKLRRKEITKLFSRLARFLLILVINLFLWFLLFNKIYPFNVDPDYSTIILANDSSLVHGFINTEDKWRMYTRLDEISPELKKAILFKEDKYFYYHFGVNPAAIIRATTLNIHHGKRTSGASTISMQVARLLEPKERNYKNKIIEVFRAFQLEYNYSKDEILQLYLNLVPYGGNIEGVKSASTIYFGKMPNHLSIAEIASLSIIPNRPTSLCLGRNNDLIELERNKWLRRYGEAQLFNREYIDDALSEPLKAYRREVPRLAPHLSYRLKKMNPGRNIIISSLDMEFQKKSEDIVKNYISREYFYNIKNATAIVIDNRSRKVLAYVGSADFNNDEDAGQVDGIRAIRSPGSTLKPLIYGLAMDQGEQTPKTMISDVPVSFGGYEPENYDGKFHGNVSVEYSLAKSLNIPAVKTLEDIGTGLAIEKLSLMGFKQIDIDRNHLGLSLVLGGCGSSLEELASFYSTLANQGLYRKLSYKVNAIETDTLRVLSPAATYMLTEILTQLERPDLPISWANSAHMPKIAWKTGTSYGRKDAWSIGYNKDYTIGVWVGNFSGEGVPELSGAEKASPLLFRLFNALDYNSLSDWYSMPEDVQLRYVCPETGELPGSDCQSDILDYFVPGISSNRTCMHNKWVLVNTDSSISYCSSCKPAVGYIEALYPNITPELKTYYINNNISFKQIPEHYPDCERMASGSAPVITSPVHENEYFVNIDDSMQVMLSCHTNSDVNTVYWYIDNKFFKSAKSNQKLFFVPKEGEVKISCSDDKGRNSDIYIQVKYSNF